MSPGAVEKVIFKPVVIKQGESSWRKTIARWLKRDQVKKNKRNRTKYLVVQSRKSLQRTRVSERRSRWHKCLRSVVRLAGNFYRKQAKY